MEKSKGILSHFGTIIRIVILIIAVAIITFFVVRFFRNRSATRETERSAQVAQSDKESEPGSRNEGNKQRESEENNSTTDNSENSQDESSIPSGIADEPDTSHHGSPMPEVGMSANILWSAAILMVVTYMVVRGKERLRA